MNATRNYINIHESLRVRRARATILLGCGSAALGVSPPEAVDLFLIKKRELTNGTKVMLSDANPMSSEKTWPPRILLGARQLVRP
jgi:hypothetical protein